MDLLKNIDKLANNRNFLIAFLDILFLVLPGLMVIFVFRTDLIANLDWIKLSLLSASITAPASFWNAMILDSWEKELASKKKSELFYLLSVSIIISGIVIDVTLLMIYLFGQKFAWGIQVFAWIEGILTLSGAYKEIRRHQKKKAKK